VDGIQSASRITADCLVQETFEHHPQTIETFVRHGLQCIGCYIAPFHTIADCAREHAVSIEPLLGDLNRAIGVETV
jgi:hybrid cluster-associated redox disulfide protein